MPVVSTLPALSSPPTNVYGLYQYVAQRIPGYDPSEYLREINSAYIHVWEEVSKIKNHYFTNTVTVTVAKSQFNYDLQYNLDGGLSAPVSARLYHITRIRVLPPAGGLFQTTLATTFNDPDFRALEANPTATATQSGPYYWVPFGRGSIRWCLPLALGTQIEVMYEFWPLALSFLFNGSVSSAGSTVAGTGTNFTQLVQPDFQASLVGPSAQEGVQSEIVVNGNNNLSQIYQVTGITNDTALTTANPITPALSAGNAYVLATLPEIPREHIRVIASIATAKMYSLAADDSRVQEWTAISQANIQMMKDSLVERQGQDPPRKIRFAYGVGRRNRTFMR